MKNYDMFVLAEQLANNIGNLKALKGAKFTYGLLKNIDLLEKEVKSVMEMSKPSEEFLVYDKARIALCETHAKKDANGEIAKKEVQPNSGQFEYDIDTTSKVWIDAIEELKVTYKEAIDIRDEQLKTYNELLSAESDIVLSKIALSDIPNDITLELMKLIQPFVKE